MSIQSPVSETNPANQSREKSRCRSTVSICTSRDLRTLFDVWARYPVEDSAPLAEHS